MKKAELIDAMEAIPDDEQVALNIGFDADNISITTGTKKNYKSHLCVGWFKHKRHAYCLPNKTDSEL